MFLFWLRLKFICRAIVRELEAEGTFYILKANFAKKVAESCLEVAAHLSLGFTPYSENYLF